MKRILLLLMALAIAATQQPVAAADQTPIVAPEGLETETYQATAYSYYQFTTVTYSVQVGYVGTEVYVQGLYSELPDSWVKGVQSGNTITFASGQYLGETEVLDAYTGESLGLYPVWLGYEDGTTGENVDFVLTINAETGVMDDLGQGALLFNTHNNECVDVVLEMRLTPMSQLDNVSYELVYPPIEAQQQAVQIKGISQNTGLPVTNAGYLAINGTDFYVAGLTPDIPAWVKGTLSADGTVTFAMGQYLGLYNNSFDMWFMATDPTGIEGNLKNAVATWNAETQTLAFDEHSCLLENADPLSMFFAEAIKSAKVTPATGTKVLTTPPAGMQTQTYQASCSSEGEYSYAQGTYPVQIGFDGTNAYMQGLFFYLPLSWIKGTLNADGSLTFAKNQYIGRTPAQGTLYDTYVVPCTDDERVLSNFTFTFDASANTYLHTQPNTKISFSISPNTAQAVEIISQVQLVGEAGGSSLQGLEATQTSVPMVYDLQGRPVKRMQKGINVVRSGNRTFKVMH